MRIAILAMGPSSYYYTKHCAVHGGRARFDEVWTVNAYGDIFHADRIFHMDDVRIQQIRADGGKDQIKVMLEWMKTHPGPIYTSRSHPDYPGLVDFPLQAVMNATGGPDYFNSTPAYAIGLALSGKKAGLPEDVSSIACFGLDYTYMANRKGERGRSCVEYWLGRARERGVAVELPKETFLMDACEKEGRLYGYDTLDVKISREDNRAVVNFIEKEPPTAEEIELRYNHD